MSQKVSYRKKVFRMDWEWGDILDTLPDGMKKRFYSLSPKTQRKIMRTCEHDLGKCLESGIMHDLNVIIEESVEYSGFNTIVNMIAK